MLIMLYLCLALFDIFPFIFLIIATICFIFLTFVGYSSCERFVLSLEEEACKSSSIAGGKGSSLALLTALSKKSNQVHFLYFNVINMFSLVMNAY